MDGIGRLLWRRRQEGWVAVVIEPDKVDVARVVPQVGQRPQVSDLVSRPLPRPGKEVETLVGLRKDMQLARYRCIALLRPMEYRLTQVDSPDVPRAEMQAAIRWRVKEVVDFPIETATVDYTEIPLEGSLPGWNRQALAVVADNAVIAAKAELFHEARLPLDVIDIPEMAQRNIASLFEPKDKGIALLVFNEHGGLLTLSYKGELYLARRLEVSAQLLRQSDADARQALLESICLEMQRTLDSFERQYTFITLVQVLVASTWGVDFVVTHLAGNLYLPVEALNLSRVLDLSRLPEMQELTRQAHWLPAIGAALRSVERGE